MVIATATWFSRQNGQYGSSVNAVDLTPPWTDRDVWSVKMNAGGVSLDVFGIAGIASTTLTVPLGQSGVPIESKQLSQSQSLLRILVQ